MDIAVKICYQVVIMFLFMAAGFTLAKAKKIDVSGVKQITSILLLLVTPCVLISSYQGKIDDFSPKLLKGLIIAAILTVLIHLAAIVISTLIFRREETGKYKINIFSSIYSNCGFMAIPILQSVLGNDGVFFGSAYLAIFTIIYWTHGVVVFAGSRKVVSPKSLVLNPGVIGTVIALLLFLLKIKLPGILLDSISGVASLNTPLSMIILGTYLANVNFAKAMSRGSLYAVSFLRLIAVPVISIFIIYVIRLLLPIESIVAQAILIPAACPVAAISALFATKFNNDATYASELVAITTLFSIVTIPLIMAFSTIFI